jgi:hypothetical protein
MLLEVLGGESGVLGEPMLGGAVNRVVAGGVQLP